MVRFAVYEAGYQDLLATLRTELPPSEFDAAWAGGEALGIDDAITYATRTAPRASGPARAGHH